MTKIMLVEDDKSLREIYGVRLLAEGYDIVSAGDGEEALAMAIKERPQLIISDVMMPKVSGYDMLDILRSTTETKNIRVIMMTALSSEEQRMRAESLGADRYLVKSQVGIEDVVRVVHEVLEDTPETMAAAATRPATTSAAPAAALSSQPTVTVNPAAPIQPGVPLPSSAQPTPVLATPSMPSPAPLPSPTKPPMSTPKPASLKSRVIQPLHDPSIAPVNINDLLDKELAKEAGLSSTEIPVVETVNQEKASIDEQLKSFIPPEPTPVEAPATASAAPVAAPGPSLLPTPGVGSATPTSPVTTPAVPAPQNPVASAPAPSVPSPVPNVPVPPAPPAPQVPLSAPTQAPAPVVSAPIPASPAPQPQPATPVNAPTAVPVAPTPPATTATIPIAAPTPSSEPVIDLTKLPEVPKV